MIEKTTVCLEDSGDVIEAAAYSVDELREAVFEGRGRLARPLALGLLTRKDYADKAADLQRILTNEGEAPRLRAMAAAALGEIQTPAALEALERGLQTQEVVTLRGVAKALARVGTAKHIKSLEDLAARPDPVGREAQRALGVLTERLKGDSGGGAPSVRTVPLERSGETTPIRIEKPADSDVAEALKSVPSRGLARESSISMECQGRQLIFVFDEEALGRGIALLKNRGEIGLVAEPRQVEGTGWEPRYRVLIEPAAQDTFKILVTTYDGRLMLAGAGQVEGQQATFHLAAADTPGALPVDIRGRFDGQRLTFERALSAVRRLPAKQPAQWRRPPG